MILMTEGLKGNLKKTDIWQNKSSGELTMNYWENNIVGQE